MSLSCLDPYDCLELHVHKPLWPLVVDTGRVLASMPDPYTLEVNIRSQSGWITKKLAINVGAEVYRLAARADQVTISVDYGYSGILHYGLALSYSEYTSSSLSLEVSAPQKLN